MSEAPKEEPPEKAMIVFASDDAIAKLTRQDVAETGLPKAELEELLEGLAELMRAVPRADTRTLTGHPCWPIRKTLVRVAARLPERGRVHELIGYMRKIPAIASRIDLDSLAANPIGFGRWLAIAEASVGEELGIKAIERKRARDEAARAPYRRLKRPAQHEHEREPPVRQQTEPVVLAPVAASVSQPAQAQPAVPAAREAPAPTKKTREEIEQAEYETLTEDQRRHIDSLTGSERSAAIQMFRSDRIIRQKADRDVVERNEMTRNALDILKGGSAKT